MIRGGGEVGVGRGLPRHVVSPEVAGESRGEPRPTGDIWCRRVVLYVRHPSSR